MKKNSKGNHASRVSDIEWNSVAAEREKKECPNNFVELLPPEVTFKIFSQLDIRSLCRASVTCRSWNHAIRHSDSVWKPHCLTVRAVCQREIDDDLESGYPWRVSLTFAIWSPLDNNGGLFEPHSTFWLEGERISYTEWHTEWVGFGRMGWLWELKSNYTLFLQKGYLPSILLNLGSIYLINHNGYILLHISKIPSKLCYSHCSVCAHSHTHLIDMCINVNT